MITIKKVLCPVDFSAASDNAVNYAARLAASYGAKLMLLHVLPVVQGKYELPADTMDVMKPVEDLTRQQMQLAVEPLKAAGIAVQGEVRTGDVHDEIRQAVARQKPGLIAMGTHGRSGVSRWFMGSVTERLMRHTPVPLLVISPVSQSRSVPQFKKILVTTDFSDGTPDAMAYALSIAQENNARIELLHVIDGAGHLMGDYWNSLVQGVRNQLEALVPGDARNWCHIVTTVDNGVPYLRILRKLKTLKPDLLVLNIHGKSVLERALLGSTAERVVRAAHCPVLLIPPETKPAKAKRKARAAHG